MFFIFNNKVENFSRSIQTHHLLPYISWLSVPRDLASPWEGKDHKIEMGFIDVEKNLRYQMPFVWKHIKVQSLTIDDKLDPYHDQFHECFVFNAEISIYTNGFKNVFQHTFTVKNGVYFFMDSILGTINNLLDKGYNVNDIDFEFLDEQCVCFNFDAANNQPSPKMALSYEITPEGFYSLIEDMDIIIHDDKDREWRRYEYGAWHIDIILKTTDKYVISIIDKILKDQSNVDCLTTYTNESKTSFSVSTEHSNSGRAWWGSYPIRKANEGTYKELKKFFTKILLTKGLQLINRESAIEYLSTKRGAIAKV